MESASYNVRTLRTTPKADPPPGLVWLRVGPDQKLYATDVGFVFLQIFEHAYLACVRTAHMALRFDDSTLEIAYYYIIFVDYMLFNFSAMKNRSNFTLWITNCAGVCGEKSDFPSFACAAASHRSFSHSLTNRAVCSLTDAIVKS